MYGVSLAGLNTTVFPVIRAPADMPAAIAKGKLNGATTAHTPYGFNIARALSPGRNVPIVCSYPWFRIISVAYHRNRSAASSTSATASWRVFPFSKDIRAAYAYLRSEIRSAARWIVRTRSRYGVADQPGNAALAALRDVRVRRSVVFVVLGRRAGRGEKFAGTFSRVRVRRSLRRCAAPFETLLVQGALLRLRQALVDLAHRLFQPVHPEDELLAL